MSFLDFLRVKFRDNHFVKKVFTPLNSFIRSCNNNKLNRTFKIHGGEAFDSFVSLMQNNQIEYWPEFGTLLGIYRDAGFIPHDNDLDFGTFVENRDRVLQVLSSSGFVLKHSYYCPDYVFIKEDTFLFKGLGIDVFYFHKEGPNDSCYSFVPNKMESGNKLNYLIKVFTFKAISLKPTSFNSHIITIPSDTEAHLKVSYGENFMTPDPYFKSINHNYLENHYGYHKEF